MLQGSPPRVWGKLILILDDADDARFTPTCVGKTWAIYRKACWAMVHPHVCGENWDEVKQGISDAGSPPRVWGKLLLQ